MVLVLVLASEVLPEFVAIHTTGRTS